MVVERSMHPQYLSNTYLVGNVGGPGFFVDAGGPVSPLIAAAERSDIRPTHILLTHHHHDHVAEIATLKRRWPELAVLAHPDERVEGVTGRLTPGEAVRIGDLEVTPLHTPGHTRGSVSFLVGSDQIVGDLILPGSVGRTDRSDASWEEIEVCVRRVMPYWEPESRLHAGHGNVMVAIEELETNPYLPLGLIE